MKITYIHHSSFFIELEKCCLIFDYFQDDGFLKKTIYDTSKIVYVFSSHRHKDHFSKKIFEWQEIKPNIKYVLSKDIAESLTGDRCVILMRKGDIYNDNNIYVKAFGSTDEGISFYLEIEDKSLFHAGDLNNWHWAEEVDEAESKSYEEFYQKELADICSEIKNVDVLMFPIDKRLGRDYYKGAIQFIENIETNLFIPMHFWGDFESANAFKPEALKRNCLFFEISNRNDSIIYE